MVDGNQMATIRVASTADAERIAALSAQLGYQSPTKVVRERLKRMLHNDYQMIFVAELGDDCAVGRIGQMVYEAIILEQQMEIEGLVVDENHRNLNRGQRLITEADAWAREKGCKNIYLRSGVVRDKAHAFYMCVGYEYVKTQLAFAKPL